MPGSSLSGGFLLYYTVDLIISALAIGNPTKCHEEFLCSHLINILTFFPVDWVDAQRIICYLDAFSLFFKTLVQQYSTSVVDVRVIEKAFLFINSNTSSF